MNIRLIALLFAFSFPAMPSMAEDHKQQSKAHSVERAAIIQSLQRGSSFTSNNQTYQYLPEVRAVRLKSNSEPLPQALHRVGATADQIIETKGPYALYRGAQRAPAQTDQNQSNGSYPAVLNARTKTIGILPGTIEVKPRSMGDVAAIAAGHGLNVVREFSHLHVVYYQVKPGQDILAVANALAADPLVSSAEVEIIEYLAVPN